MPIITIEPGVLFRGLLLLLLHKMSKNVNLMTSTTVQLQVIENCVYIQYTFSESATNTIINSFLCRSSLCVKQNCTGAGCDFPS